MKRLAWLVMSLSLAGCHVCDYRLDEGPTSLTLPRGSACPAAADVDPARLNDSTVEVESFVEAIDDPGQQECCYRAHVHRPALDEEITVTFDRASSCARGSRCDCPSPSSLLSSPDRSSLDGLPEGADLVAVVSGPSRLDDGACEYQARASRPAIDAVEPRCERVSLGSDGFDLGACTPPSALLGADSPLARSGRETVTKIDGGASIDEARSALPSRRCVYRVKYKESADVCG